MSAARLTRRAWLAGFGGSLAAFPRAADAQSATKTFIVGYCGIETAPSPYLEAFRDGLRRLGYVDGRAEGRRD